MEERKIFIIFVVIITILHMLSFYILINDNKKEELSGTINYTHLYNNEI